MSVHLPQGSTYWSQCALSKDCLAEQDDADKPPYAEHSYKRIYDPSLGLDDRQPSPGTCLHATDQTNGQSINNHDKNILSSGAGSGNGPNQALKSTEASEDHVGGTNEEEGDDEKDDDGNNC